MLGLVLRPVASAIASGEGTIANGPAAGLRIDASGRLAGYVLGTSDYPEQEWLVETLKPGDVFCDAGAAIGFFTLLGARLVGPEGRVVSFEPLAESAAQLRKNVGLNQFAHVEVVEAALADEPGTAALYTEPGRWFRSRLLPRGVTNAHTVTVDVTTLDLAFARRRPPDVIKIDVEGLELEVLKGALSLINAAKPTILAEVHWLGERFSNFVSDHLAPIGYRCTTLDGDPIPTRPERIHALLRPS